MSRAVSQQVPSHVPRATLSPDLDERHCLPGKATMSCAILETLPSWICSIIGHLLFCMIMHKVYTCISPESMPQFHIAVYATL